VQDIPDGVRDLVRDRAPSMDHIDVLMRLHQAGASPMTRAELVIATRLSPETVDRALDDLVTSGLAAEDGASGSYRYAPRGPGDRATVDALAALYNHRPVTLVKLVYEQPPAPVKSFADAFRLRPPSSEQ
jgi:hypothetical protein